MVSIRSLSIIDSSETAHRDFIPASSLFQAYQYQGEQRVRRDDFVCQHAFSFPTVLADGTVVACEQDFNGKQPYGVVSAERSFASISVRRTGGPRAPCRARRLPPVQFVHELPVRGPQRQQLQR